MAKKIIDLPLHQDSSSVFVPWIIGLMVYVTILACTCALTLSFYIKTTTQEELPQLTVEVPISHAQNYVEVEEKVLAALKNFPDIISMHPVPRQQFQSALTPWLNQDEQQKAFSSLPFPLLVDIVLKKNAPDVATEILKELQEISPEASLLMHREWLSHLMQWLETIEWLAWVSAGLFLLVALLAVASAVRTGVTIHSSVIEILNLMGASEGYISRQFQRQALKTTFKSFLFTAFLLVLTFIFFRLFLEGESFSFPFNDVFYSQLIILFVSVPLITTCLILLITRLTVILSLKYSHF